MTGNVDDSQIQRELRCLNRRECFREPNEVAASFSRSAPGTYVAQDPGVKLVAHLGTGS